MACGRKRFMTIQDRFLLEITSETPRVREDDGRHKNTYVVREGGTALLV